MVRVPPNIVRRVSSVGHDLCALAFLTLLVSGAVPVRQTPNLSGNWIRSDFGELGPTDSSFDLEMLTSEGQRLMGSYDFLTDDPAYGCVPASWARVWSNPNVVVQITQAADSIRLRYEWMDIDREIPLVDPSETDAPRVRIPEIPTLGRSMAWYDADTLVVDTVDYSQGYVSTITNLAGLPQSRTMHTVERIRRVEDMMTIEITHLDLTVFREPFVMSMTYAPTEYELLEYGCTPEEAGLVAPD